MGTEEVFMKSRNKLTIDDSQADHDESYRFKDDVLVKKDHSRPQSQLRTPYDYEGQRKPRIMEGTGGEIDTFNLTPKSPRSKHGSPHYQKSPDFITSNLKSNLPSKQLFQALK